MQPKNVNVKGIEPVKPLDKPPNLKLPEHINPNDPLSLGVYFHEEASFENSAYYFSLAASNGDPTGLFLYAISMRHGWGMEKNEERAFKLVFYTLLVNCYYRLFF
jgi:TPR repeat protein